jgi:predicted dehydrogenase
MTWFTYDADDGTPRRRIGVIGLSFGMNHAQSATIVPEATLVAACALHEEHRRPIEAMGARYYTDYRQMLDTEKLDGVVVALPNDLHAQATIECLGRGLPVLVEKPVAATLAEADRIVAATETSGVPVLVGHHRRFSPFCVRARQALVGGELGDLIGASVMWTMLKPKDYFDAKWRTLRATGGGPLLINTIHNIDDLRYITGREVTRIYAEVSNKTRGFEVEDTISITARLQGDALVTIFVSDCAPGLWAWESTTSPWENPHFYYQPADCYYFFGTKGALTLPTMQHVYYPDPEKASWQHPLQVDHLGVKPAHPLRLEMSHFCRVIRGLETPRTTAADARKTLAGVIAIMQSRDGGKPVDLAG